jgi:hypothetical protein
VWKVSATLQHFDARGGQYPPRDLGTFGRQYLIVLPPHNECGLLELREPRVQEF